MKHKLLAIGILAISLCTGCEMTNTSSGENQAHFTMPGTAVDMMSGEVPFANFTIDDDEVRTITYEETSTAQKTTTAEDDEETEETEETVESVEPSDTELPSVELTNPENPEFVVVLDPGHGGELPGAMYNGFQEKDLSLDIAFRVREYLLSHYSNVAVFMTRAEDKGFFNDQSLDLEYRVNFAVQHGANVLVSLHFNVDAVTHHSKGCLTFISKQPWVYEQSLSLSNCILGNLVKLGMECMGPFTYDSDKYFDDYGNPLDYYAINRNAASNGLVGIIVEHAFLDNPDEVQFFGTEEARNKMAAADAIGIAQYLGLQPR